MNPRAGREHPGPLTVHNESVTTAEGRPSASGAATSGDAVRGHVVARIVTIVVALFWGVAFFGVIDLITVPIQDETFYQHYLIETGWGLLYTLLVMVPLILWAVRPQWRVFPQQVFVVAAAVLLTGLLTPAPRQVLVAILLALSVVPSAGGVAGPVAGSRALAPRRRPDAARPRRPGCSRGSDLRRADDRGRACRQAR